MRVTSVKQATGMMALLTLGCLPLVAAERVTLMNGFTVDCVRHETAEGRTRLVLAGPADGTEPAYMDVAAGAIASIAVVPDPVVVAPAAKTDGWRRRDRRWDRWDRWRRWDRPR